MRSIDHSPAPNGLRRRWTVLCAGSSITKFTASSRAASSRQLRYDSRTVDLPNAMPPQMEIKLRRYIPEFAAPEAERAFRLWSIEESKSSARWVVAIGSIVVPLFIGNDYVLLGLSVPF